MIDLHTHTSYSDGTWSVEKLLEEAQKANIEVLSITDHDNVDANKELLEGKYAGIYNGKMISGC
jgi:predicted metal-dependent phosphoesterase TrpH